MNSDSQIELSILASPNIAGEKRRLQNLEAKRRQRARQRDDGAREVVLTISSAVATELEILREIQRGPVEGFYARALLVGARFLANAGTPRGRKIKSNGMTAERNPAIADESAMAQGDHCGHGRERAFSAPLNPRRDGAQGNVE